MESQLQAAQGQDHGRIQKMLKSLNLGRDEYWEEWHIAQQEHEMTYEMLLPNFLRYSYIVLLFLVIENKLGEICRAIYEVRENIASPPQPTHEIVKKYKDYIEKDAKITNLKWEPIHDLNKVRNCIVHASGKVTGSKHETRLRQLAKKKDGLFISSYNHDFQGQVQPLYFEDDILVLESEYCKRVVKTVQIFFEELCDKIPLPRLSVSFLDD
jgi:hypothetical protein